MQRISILSTLIAMLALDLPSPVLAQVDVYVKGKPKPLNGTVLADSVLGLRLKGLDTIPAEQIVDVFHTVEPTSVQIAYRQATTAEKAAVNVAAPEERIKAIGDAIRKYEEALAKIDAKQYAARRHVEFKVAYLTALQALEEGKQVSLTLASGKLKGFRTKHPDCWQFATVMLTLARVQAAQGEFTAAEETYKIIAEHPKLSEGTKNEAALQVVRMSMQARKYPEALKKLKELSAVLTKDHPQMLSVQLAEAECHAATGNIAAASAILKKLLKETKDRDIRAIAHNTLGYCYYEAKQLQEARWEFLWVDVVYNQNKAEHAKALYYLAKIFQQLNDPDRAQECLEMLLNDRQFQGLEFQRRAAAEQK